MHLRIKFQVYCMYYVKYDNFYEMQYSLIKNAGRN